ncbi:hypothetical protein EDD18DRAFT_1144746 [Armillaria luteobubalina]|uniref:Uncharacterized protein n=1 Tax=Armillaria luteobubalina TaxID=153913 RepID=A0AA39QHB9_9AGAR|nr:hypothetical protein EDD18DRAFT_1144746 [Armillaria luteobubalina]
MVRLYRGPKTSSSLQATFRTVFVALEGAVILPLILIAIKVAPVRGRLDGFPIRAYPSASRKFLPSFTLAFISCNIYTHACSNDMMFVCDVMHE